LVEDSDYNNNKEDEMIRSAIKKYQKGTQTEKLLSIVSWVNDVAPHVRPARQDFGPADIA
jgi:hypothetical protein